MVDMTQYRHPVRRSLMDRDLILGVPQTGLLAVFLFVMVFVYTLSMWYMAIPAAILYLVMYFLTKRDPYMVDIFISNLNQKDIYTA